jgi:hypothetical protein
MIKTSPKSILVHPCGETLNGMVNKIRKAIFCAVYNKNTPDEARRMWFLNQMKAYEFHECVSSALEIAFPKDLHQLVLEHPHVSSDGRLAYTQNDEKGDKNIQTVTTIGRYLKRHFPTLPDHEIRGLSVPKTGCRIVKTMDEMQDALMRGPSSCMKWNDRENPYLSYCPTLGWGLAINEVRGEVEGRALVHFPTMKFVRTYRRDGSSTVACELLQHWLKGAGFEHACAWSDGTKLLYLDDLAPYLDGNTDTARREGAFWVIDSDGGYTLNNTDGSVDSNNDDDYIGCCVCCDSSVYEGNDRIWAGVDEDDIVCSRCQGDYTYVYGRNEGQYYIHDNRTVYIGGENYDRDYLHEQQELRRAHDGEYFHEDDCFYCDVVGEYYSNHEASPVTLEDGRTAAMCNAWQCNESDEWYGNDEFFVEVNGARYHPNHVPETKDETLPEEENEPLEEHA